MIGFYGRQKRNIKRNNAVPAAVLAVESGHLEPGRVRCFMLELPFMLGPARVGGRSREIVEGPGKEYLRRISGRLVGGASIEPREN
jgi:hypothetical protein